MNRPPYESILITHLSESKIQQEVFVTVHCAILGITVGITPAVIIIVHFAYLK